MSADCAPKGSILIAEDETAVRESLAEVLRDEGYEVTAVADGDAAIAALDSQEIDLVISDLRMPGADGLTVLSHARNASPQTFVLLMTAHATVETAVEALQRGAQDYLLKPLIFDDVLHKISHLLQHRQVAWENQMLRNQVAKQWDFDNLVGRSGAMRDVMKLVQRVAPTKSTVLITGESGAGKEVVARAIHHFSEQRDRIFLPVNCGAIPENLLESQLFGHLRGSFTGAVANQEGLFARARGGTIFLDEIGDLPLGLQVKLLRAIEQKEILPVGATTPSKVDVRVIAATNSDLAKAVEDGRFREDLFYRLNVVGIEIPPLRERREDLPLLIEHFVRIHNRELKRNFKGVDGATMKILMASPWKGNVRELDNVIEHAMILGEGDWITPADLPRALQGDATVGTPAGDDLREAMRSYEKAHIRSVLLKADHDKKRAAELLGVSLSSLYRKIEELQIT
ncbi:MAG: Fis family transcriptional regulator [Polyangiaceae bacterium UTPRO1]|jgi:two-component system response regulator PilR (NtrC family)|nr:sigma-54 dependent transcriptional regulator [Myxococcales bacterium]OQY66550.1 MAG: Fis family transcriptional regulator [Polyangiaceae bacterium UTPRO1]